MPTTALTTSAVTCATAARSNRCLTRSVQLLLLLTAAFCGLLLSGCASVSHDTTSSLALEDSNLPTPDLSLKIEGLGPCIDQPDRTIRLRSTEPVTVLVHGCNASAGRFRTLAQVFAHQGQQTVCYSYDDRRSLAAVATDLHLSLQRLSEAMEYSDLTLIGHSQGGLIARHALQESGNQDQTLAHGRQRLITLSSPFSGISAADHCASPLARVISLGLVVPVCWAISGEKWYEITHASDFISKPGRLQSSVERHLLIRTDERSSCRQREKERCVEDDYVFSLDEQVLPAGAVDERVVEEVIRVGHAAVVGTNNTIPRQLIALLQERQILRQTPLSSLPEFQRYLARLYRHQPEFASDSAP
jgi:pimeloyl-ACP methyl ester carboxylesterase